jgi:hypothetical protein
LFGPRQQRAASKSTLRRLSPALAATLIMGLMLAAGWILFSRRFSRDFGATIRAASMIIFAILTFGLLLRGVMQLRRGAAAGSDRTFDYGLSVALPMLCSAILLSLIVGLPLKLEERRAVAAMNASNHALEVSREIDQHLWQPLKEHMQRAPE